MLEKCEGCGKESQTLKAEAHGVKFCLDCWYGKVNRPNTHPYVASKSYTTDWILATDSKEVER